MAHAGWFSVAIGGVALVVVGIGAWNYLTLSKDYERLLAVTQKLRATVATLEDNLSLTEYEREKLNGTLAEATTTLGALEQQTTTLNDQVATFEKLQSLDPELLKKYSKVYFLNEHYAPSLLVPIDTLYKNEPTRTLEFHAQAYPFLARMIEDANETGLSLRVASAYRSFKTQESLKAANKVTYGAGTANQFSADQGYSEHQLGTTVDLTTKTMKGLGQAFDKTPEFTWMTAHAHEYGFILSYPKGNKYYIYEPWHWRFVGVALATKLYEDGERFYDVDQRTIDEYLISIFD